ncbi:SAM-dependent methyltransferase [Actinomadura syzygii]|uniref:SAM-dependent methyltransferase n=1 Tax=Actinomadura syzygii TaxID=1427538 RepID=A0A5D0TYS6_9ACTN|nr:SAM-dependent methyltransferase [Actinomadura syzygii]TYC10049.1 SAM-dependent methyltransferase [Actinomadura syzygii]
MSWDKAPAVSSTDKINTEEPNAARLWDYLLGGKDHYQVDREAAAKVAAILPGYADAARHERAFLARAVRHLAGEAGIRQFLDIGVGLPAAADNTHEVAQRAAPDARVVYVDNDPLVLSYARALHPLTCTRQGGCGVVDADARDVEVIVREAAWTLDFDQPVGLLLLNILNYIVVGDEAQAMVKGLVAALAPGSYVVIAHPTAEADGERVHEAMEVVMDMGGASVVARTPQRIEGFLEGLELLDPGVVSCSHWRPDPWPPPAPVLQFCGVARVPDQEPRR